VGFQEKIKNRGEEKCENINVQRKNAKTLVVVVVIMMIMTKTTILKPITMALLMEMNILVAHIRARKKQQYDSETWVLREEGTRRREIS
jgi:hypothetical protein